MNMGMGMDATVTMGMTFFRELPGHQHESAVLYTPLGNNALREVLDCRRLATERGNLHAVLVIQMHMERREDQVMVIMKVFRESPGKFPGPVVVDVDQGTDGRGAFGGLLRHLAQARPRQIPDCLGAVGIPACFDKGIEVCHQLVIESNRDPLHVWFQGEG